LPAPIAVWQWWARIWTIVFENNFRPKNRSHITHCITLGYYDIDNHRQFDK